MAWEVFSGGGPFYVGGHTNSHGLRTHSCDCNPCCTVRLFLIVSLTKQWKIKLDNYNKMISALVQHSLSLVVGCRYYPDRRPRRSTVTYSQKGGVSIWEIIVGGLLVGDAGRAALRGR